MKTVIYKSMKFYIIRAGAFLMRKITHLKNHDTWRISLAPFMLGLLLSFPSVCFGDSQDLPGLSVARLALPSISKENLLLQPTGTPIGEKAIDLKRIIRELCDTSMVNLQQVRNLYGKAITEVDGYHRLTGEIEAKLQLGTTPANPNLIKLGELAQMKLHEFSIVIEAMAGRARDFQIILQKGDALNREIKETLLMPGALDEDHANLLKMAEELDSFKTSILQSLNILTGNAQRQRDWLIAERSHFANLSNAIEKGKSYLSTQRSPDYPKFVELPDIPASSQSRSAAQVQVKPEERFEKSALPLKITNEKVQPELEVEFIPSNPIVHPVLEEVEVPPIKEEMLTASQALKGRHPISEIEIDQPLQQQKWYLFATVQRALKSPTDKIEIVNVIKSEAMHKRGDEVKSLLIEMGIPSHQIVVTNMRSDDDQVEKVFIF